MNENTNISAIPIIVLAVSLGVLGQILMKHGMNQYRRNPPPGASGKFSRDLKYIFSNVWVLGGFGSYGVSTIIWLYVLTRADLSFAYPFISISYIAVILLGPVLFHESIDRWKVVAIALIIMGVICMTISEKLAEDRAFEKHQGKIALIAPEPDSSRKTLFNMH